MADLAELDRAETVKIAGANPSTGIADNFMEVDTAGRITVKLNDASGSAINLGQSTMAGSISVAIASNQSALSTITSYSDTAPANQTITVLDTGTSSLAGANGQIFYFSTPTTNSTAIFALSSIGMVSIQANLLGTGGTLVVEVSSDGGSFWVRPNVFQPSTQNYTNGFTAPFIALLNVAGMTHVRVRAITSWSGTATIIVKETINQRAVTIGDSLPAGSNVIGGVTQSGTWNINNISGTISLPTGAATAANQAIEISSLQLIDNIIGPVTAGTAAVASALIGGQFNTSLPTLTNSEQAALQTDSSARLIIAPLTNTSIVKAQLEDNAGAAITLGQKNSANSVPVVLPSDQVITVTSSPLPITGSKFSFGELATASSATFLAVESTAYTEPTTNSTMTLVSSSTNDSSAGTGARTVVVTYLDQTGAGPFTATFTMNGTTAVNSGLSNMCFIEKIVVATVGSTGSNVGILTLKTGGAATVGTVAATLNQTLWAHHYVPTGKTCYISGFSYGNNASAVGNGGQFVLRASTPTVANTPEIQVSDFLTIVGGSSTNTRTYLSPIQVVGPSRIKTYVSPYANAATTQFASFDFIDN